MNYMTAGSRRRIFVMAIVGPLLSIFVSACAATKAPCLEYTSQSFKRTVSMRGYGTVEMTEEALVCKRPVITP